MDKQLQNILIKDPPNHITEFKTKQIQKPKTDLLHPINVSKPDQYTLTRPKSSTIKPKLIVSNENDLPLINEPHHFNLKVKQPSKSNRNSPTTKHQRIQPEWNMEELNHPMQQTRPMKMDCNFLNTTGDAFKQNKVKLDQYFPEKPQKGTLEFSKDLSQEAKCNIIQTKMKQNCSPILRPRIISPTTIPIKTYSKSMVGSPEIIQVKLKNMEKTTSTYTSLQKANDIFTKYTEKPINNQPNPEKSPNTCKFKRAKPAPLKENNLIFFHNSDQVNRVQRKNIEDIGDNIVQYNNPQVNYTRGSGNQPQIINSPTKSPRQLRGSLPVISRPVITETPKMVNDDVPSERFVNSFAGDIEGQIHKGGKIEQACDSQFFGKVVSPLDLDKYRQCDKSQVMNTFVVKKDNSIRFDDKKYVINVNLDGIHGANTNLQTGQKINNFQNQPNRSPNLSPRQTNKNPLDNDTSKDQYEPKSGANRNSYSNLKACLNQNLIQDKDGNVVPGPLSPKPNMAEQSKVVGKINIKKGTVTQNNNKKGSFDNTNLQTIDSSDLIDTQLQKSPQRSAEKRFVIKSPTKRNSNISFNNDVTKDKAGGCITTPCGEKELVNRPVITYVDPGAINPEKPQKIELEPTSKIDQNQPQMLTISEITSETGKSSFPQFLKGKEFKEEDEGEVEQEYEAIYNIEDGTESYNTFHKFADANALNSEITVNMLHNVFPNDSKENLKKGKGTQRMKFIGQMGFTPTYTQNHNQNHQSFRETPSQKPFGDVKYFKSKTKMVLEIDPELQIKDEPEVELDDDDFGGRMLETCYEDEDDMGMGGGRSHNNRNMSGDDEEEDCGFDMGGRKELSDQDCEMDGMGFQNHLVNAEYASPNPDKGHGNRMSITLTVDPENACVENIKAKQNKNLLLPSDIQELGQEDDANSLQDLNSPGKGSAKSLHDEFERALSSLRSVNMDTTKVKKEVRKSLLEIEKDVMIEELNRKLDVNIQALNELNNSFDMIKGICHDGDWATDYVNNLDSNQIIKGVFGDSREKYLSEESTECQKSNFFFLMKNR